MSSIVVLGSGSFLGKVLLNNIRGDVQIKAVVRKIPIDSSKYTKKVQWIKIDTISTSSLNKIFKKGDVIINLIYVRDGNKKTNIDIINNIIEACIISKVSRLIHCSTASVVGDVKTQNINELTPCNPKTDYEKIKMYVEQMVLNSLSKKVDVGILRPTAIVGHGGKNLEKLANSLIYGNKLVNYLKTCVLGYTPMHLVPVRNVVSALMHLAFYKNNLNGNIFIVSADHDINNNFLKVEEILINELGLDSNKFPRILIPKIFQIVLFKILRRGNLNLNRKFLSKKLSEYGYTPTDTIKDAIYQFAKSIKRKD